MTTIMLDLDGTLVDPASGIIRACQIALNALDVEAPSTEELHWIIGPPLRKSFSHLLGGDDRVEAAIGHYRSYYSDRGIFEATPYEGIHEAVSKLKAQATQLFVCTSKPRPFAERVVERFGLLSFFDDVYGAELDGRFEDKGDLIGHMLECEGFKPENACMIGDRLHDVAAARRHGIRTVGVLWGYGGRDELTSAGATVTCERPRELPATVADLLR